MFKLFARLSPAQRSLIAAVAGFFFYGGWAYVVNYQHGPMASIKAACVQGAYSFILTLCMTLFIEGIFKLMTHYFGARWLINWTTIVVSCAVVFTGSWVINHVAGTPEIFRTVILGYVIGGVYCIAYVRGLASISDTV